MVVETQSLVLPGLQIASNWNPIELAEIEWESCTAQTRRACLTLVH